MSEAETRKLVERYLAAFNAADHEGMLDCLAEDVAHDLPNGKREIGKEQFRWHLAERARHFRDKAADIAVMTAPGGVRAAAEFTLLGDYLSAMEGLPEARGQRYRISAGMFFDVDDGLISRLTFCLSNSALRAQLERG